MITCDDCGLCCLHMAVPPYDEEEREILREANPEVYRDLLAVDRTRKLQLAVVGTDFVPCGFLEPLTRRCIHHDHSPDVCYRFEVGGQLCRAYRKDAGFVDAEVMEPA